MHIQINQKYYYEDELTFIAVYQNMEDQHCYYHYRETLLLAGDGTYILKCQGNPGSRYHRTKHGVPVRSLYFKHEPHPGIWLLQHGHQRLAGLMFTELRPSIEAELLSKYIYTEPKNCDSLYDSLITPNTDI
ncbi:MAG TPA: hypothetical protein VFW78_03655 [Bacteroidia bacterium]|nr:hypothetical protein [Bacteroidia bacterium]